MADKIDLGSGFAYSLVGWHPDRELNPQYEGIPDVEVMGCIIWRGDEALGSCHFNTPEVNAVFPEGPKWELHSLDPLHIEPSIQMYEKDGKTPSYHGHIRDGKWVSA